MNIYNSDLDNKQNPPILFLDLDLSTTTLGSLIEIIRKTPNNNIDIICTCTDASVYNQFEYMVDYLKECGKNIRMFYRGTPLCTDSTDTFKFHVKLKYYSEWQINAYKLIGY